MTTTLGHLETSAKRACPLSLLQVLGTLAGGSVCVEISLRQSKTRVQDLNEERSFILGEEIDEQGPFNNCWSSNKHESPGLSGMAQGGLWQSC